MAFDFMKGPANFHISSFNKKMMKWQLLCQQLVEFDQIQTWALSYGYMPVYQIVFVSINSYKKYTAFTVGSLRIFLV